VALSGAGAMLLYYDIAPEAVLDHDDWHTHEHFPERVGIPGFLRASRWVAASGPRYCVLYEVEDVGVLTGVPYLERLNHPTPWTSRMMPSFRGMVRGFCRVSASGGMGLGGALHTLRLSVLPGRENELRGWIAEQLPAIASRPGLSSAHLLEPAVQPPMTKEQSIRGQDAPMPWVVMVSGYDAQAVTRSVGEGLSEALLAANGSAPGWINGAYALHGLLTAAESAARH
jgi:hypothetical protein